MNTTQHTRAHWERGNTMTELSTSKPRSFNMRPQADSRKRTRHAPSTGQMDTAVVLTQAFLLAKAFTPNPAHARRPSTGSASTWPAKAPPVQQPGAAANAEPGRRRRPRASGARAANPRACCHHSTRACLECLQTAATPSPLHPRLPQE
eukprot:4345916-Alexandrium_andersonii.AAC.1